MARSRPHSPASPSPPPPGVPSPEPPEGFTGRTLVLLREDGAKEGLSAIKSATGLAKVCSAADFPDSAVEMTQADESEVFLLDGLKVAVVDADPSQIGALSMAAADDGVILAVEPERIMYALGGPDDLAARSIPYEYLRGYKDAVDHLFASLTDGPTEADAELLAAILDDAQFTWGLQATRTSASRFSGRGVRVAVLDTGFDLDHPDFAGRSVTTQSFVQGQRVDDGNGHGTHCIGTALGSQRPVGTRRYGCAFRGEIFVGKVLSNQGSGSDSGILAGINWAIANRCRVISMSLGAATQPGEPFSTIYETVAQRALSSNPGTLIVAAAGNDSAPSGVRLNPPRSVSRPANCPSIMAVAAVDSNLRVASFSNGGTSRLAGGGVDLAGPGARVFSSWPAPALVSGGPARYHTISGTSMATPHVAGIAALWLEARGAGTSAQALWQILTGNARRLNGFSRDVGAGLVQAPI